MRLLRSGGVRAAMVLGLVAAGLTVVIPPADAVTFTVNTNLDPSPDGCDAVECSLREAIEDANDDINPDIVVAQAATTYSLTGGAGGTIEVTSPIFLDGNGSTITGGPALNSRLFKVEASGDLTIDETTLTDGQITGSGGAILNEGILEVEDSTLLTNSATIGGGAISTIGTSQLTVTNSTFDQNVAEIGGAIDAGGEFVIRGSTFTNNDAAEGGGAMIIGTSSPDAAQIFSSTFTDNETDRDGGAIFNNSTADVQIDGSTFTLNDALGLLPASGGGGAIVNSSGSDLTITNSTFDSNTAFERGGAIFNTGTLDVFTSLISGNIADGTVANLANGGGIADAGVLQIVNSTITDNEAEDNGGGLFTSEEPQITNSTFTENAADRNADDVGNGGATFGSGGLITVTGSILFGDDDHSPNATVQKECGGGAVSDGGGNVVESGDCPLTVDSSVDPGLGPLQDNGGPTKTRAIAAGSSAIDLNDSDTACGGTDQRGAPRPVDEDCDAGAYELVLCGGGTVNVVGTDDADVGLTGTSGDDVILGLDGSDVILALAGNDKVCAGEGVDKVKGGPGNDKLFGDAGADTLNGGGGRDKCIGGPGKDRFAGCEKRR